MQSAQTGDPMANRYVREKSPRVLVNVSKERNVSANDVRNPGMIPRPTASYTNDVLDEKGVKFKRASQFYPTANHGAGGPQAAGIRYKENANVDDYMQQRQHSPDLNNIRQDDLNRFRQDKVL